MQRAHTLKTQPSVFNSANKEMEQTKALWFNKLLIKIPVNAEYIVIEVNPL